MSPSDVHLVTPLEKGPVFATRFSKSGQYLLTASLDGTVCVWDVRKKILFGQYDCHKSSFIIFDCPHHRIDNLSSTLECCLDVEWLSDDIFASAGADAEIQIMRVGSSTPLKTLRCAGFTAVYIRHLSIFAALTQAR